MDTRSGLGGTRLGPGEYRSIGVTGKGGVPTNDDAADTVIVEGVALNVTITGPDQASHLSIAIDEYGASRTSTINFTPGQTLANAAIAQLDDYGKLGVFNNAGHVDVIIDVEGWYSAGTGVIPGGMRPSYASRLMDTRVGLGGSRMAGGEVRSLTVNPSGWSDGPKPMGAVALNVTVTGAAASGHLTLWPSGPSMPTASNLNFAPGQTVANAVVAGVGADGRINLAVGGGAGGVDVIVDLDGWYEPSPVTDDGGFTATVPQRLMDTRQSLGGPKLQQGETRRLHVADIAGAPSDSIGAVVLNVTGVNATAPTHLTVWPGGITKPTASNLNLVPGRTTPNQVVVGVSPDGDIDIFNNAGSIDVVVDLDGWILGPPREHHVTGPRVAIDDPVDAATVDASSSGVVEVHGTVADADAGLASLVVSVDGAPIGSPELSGLAVDATDWVAVLTAGAGGEHTISVEATDRAGNLSRDSVTVTVVMPAPDVSIRAPNVHVLSELGASVVDISSYHLTLRGGLASTLVPGDVLVSGPTAGAPDGFMGRAQRVSTTGADVSIWVSPASIGDVLISGHLLFDLDAQSAPATRAIDASTLVNQRSVSVEGTVAPRASASVDVTIVPDPTWAFGGKGAVGVGSARVTNDLATDLTVTPDAPLFGNSGWSTFDSFSVVQRSSVDADGIPIVATLQLDGTGTMAVSGALLGAASWRDTAHGEVTASFDGASDPADLSGHEELTSVADGIPDAGVASGSLITMYVLTATVRTEGSPLIDGHVDRRAQLTSTVDQAGTFPAYNWSRTGSAASTGHLWRSSVESGPLATDPVYSHSTPGPSSHGVHVPSISPEHVDLNSTFLGEVGPAGPVIYTFDGQAGQLIRFDASSSVRVLDSSLHDLTPQVPLPLYYSMPKQFRLPETGQYLVVPSAALWSHPTTYQVHLTTVEVDATPLAFDEPAGRVIAPPAGTPTPRLAFDGTAGERLRVSVASSPMAWFAITAPGGAITTPPLDSHSSFQTVSITLPQTGSYYLDVLAPPGSSSTAWVATQLVTPSLVVNDPDGLTIELNMPGELYVIPLEVAAGQQVNLFATSETSYSRFCLVPPGDPIPSWESGCTSSLDVDITEPGTWHVIATYASTRVKDTLTLHAWSPFIDPKPIALNSPIARRETVSFPGQSVGATFAGTAGDRVRLVSTVYGLSPTFQVKGPDGTVIVTGVPREIVLPTTGTYTLVIGYVASRSMSTGSVNWRLSTPAVDPVPLVLNDPVPRHEKIDVPYREVEATFDGEAGQRRTLTVMPSSSDQRLEVVVVRPDGATYSPALSWSQNGAINAMLLLPQTGSYTVRVFDESWTTGDLTLRYSSS